jgi:hypothetical protein
MKGDCQPSGNYLNSSDVLNYLSISSAILNFQNKGDYQPSGNYLNSNNVLHQKTVMIFFSNVLLYEFIDENWRRVKALQ